MVEFGSLGALMELMQMGVCCCRGALGCGGARSSAVHWWCTRSPWPELWAEMTLVGEKGQQTTIQTQPRDVPRPTPGLEILLSDCCSNS